MNTLKLLEPYSKGRCVGLKELNYAAKSPKIKTPKAIQIAIVQSIRSIMLIQVHESDLQTGGGFPIKCCTRLQCCQVEEDEFQRLFRNFTKVKPERIWLGDKQSTRR